MKAKTVLDIYNLALSAVHAKGRLTTLNDNKRERVICEDWYDTIVRAIQEAAYWPCCRGMARLVSEVERNTTADWVDTDPDPTFNFSYGLPYDLLRPWHLANYDSFVIGYNTGYGEMRLNTNTEDPILVYAFYQERIDLWSREQVMATVYALAAHIAGPLTGRGELIEKNLTLANGLLENARATAIDHTYDPKEHIPQTILARGYHAPDVNRRFYYPLGSLLSISA